MRADISRRRFLSRSGALAAVAAVGLYSETPSAGSNSPLERLHVGAIGVGNRGQTNLSELAGQEMVDIVALCDVDRDNLDRIAPHFPAAARYDDFRELLQRDDLDAVIVSTPDHTHVHAAVTAIRKGLHVYCERPLAHSVFEARLMARLAEEKQVVTQMGNQHHSSDGYRRAAELVQSGAIGEVREAHCWSNRPLWPQGVGRPPQTPPVPKQLNWDLWLGGAPWRPFHQAYLPVKWRGWWDFGGGALGDMGPHLIDPVYWALKLTFPITVEAESSPVNDETAPSWSMVRFRFARRDTLPALTLTWYDGGKLPPQRVTGTSRPPSSGALMLGSRAKLFLPQLGGDPLLIPHDRGDVIEQPKALLGVSPGHHRQWIEACRSGGTTGSDFSYGARLSETCLLGNVAIRAGQQIQWDAENMKAANCPAADAYLRRDYRAGWEL